MCSATPPWDGMAPPLSLDRQGQWSHPTEELFTLQHVRMQRGSPRLASAQPVAAPSRSAAPAATLGWPALVTEVPVPAKAGVVVITLLCHEQSRNTAVHH
jgi:hypothetical protein